LALITVGQQEIQNDFSWSIYPNPAKENIYISNFPSSIQEVELIDLSGKVTRKKLENNSISLQNLQSGTFWLRVMVNGKIEQQKFIKL
jgi:hypothetical protein